ncbi:diaminopimelate epimerase [Clostridium sp. SYSU_GA19001]|uniref:diaminopimelate epimerase n=1 Tax=Clostridium caldaquaticum TaxID=2940653 RepID=UPI00207749E4|nr:diaminopimelate epimerase [Clostridium caldaquaticum]MCM8711023.1 diaminopimelate epimerase [Clostridium caldaquaticum]
MKFTKMHGNGNDFIVIEDLDNKITDEGALARELCNRNFGIGGDGILIVRKSNIAHIQMVIINSDGSYAAMCGNGIRCFAKYVWENNLVSSENIDIETGDGIKKAYLTIEDNEVKTVTINMGTSSFKPHLIPAKADEEIINKTITAGEKKFVISSLLMGVPHTVILGQLESFDVNDGKLIEKHSMFPQGTNVNFCEVINRNKIKVMTWERGAGPTLACGTGSCAAVVVANKLGLIEDKATVLIPGGSLFIEITNEGVFMTGPAVVSFQGEYNKLK